MYYGKHLQARSLLFISTPITLVESSIEIYSNRRRQIIYKVNTRQNVWDKQVPTALQIPIFVCRSTHMLQHRCTWFRDDFGSCVPRAGLSRKGGVALHRHQTNIGAAQAILDGSLGHICFCYICLHRRVVQYFSALFHVKVDMYYVCPIDEWCFFFFKLV